MLRNDATHFGWTSRLIHWSMALLILSLLVLGTELAKIQPGLATLWRYGLPKTMGLTDLGLVLIRLIWHRISPPPAHLAPPKASETRAVHHLTNLLLVLIPVAGWVYASATGLDILFADRSVITPIAPVSQAWEDAGRLAHSILTKLVMAVLVVHVAGALRRVVQRDGTLRRMTLG